MTFRVQLSLHILLARLEILRQGLIRAGVSVNEATRFVLWILIFALWQSFTAAFEKSA